MRKGSLASVLWVITLLLASGAPAPGAEPKEPAPAVKGIFLITPYPALSVSAGETATVEFKLRNYGLPPQPLALSVLGLPEGWSARFIGNNHKVEAAMPAPGEAVDLQLRLDVPQGTERGTFELTVQAAGADARATLPVKITLGNILPARLSLRPELPSLKGSPSASFTFNFDVRNDGGADLVVSFAAAGPPHFQTSFSKQYDQQEISSLPIKAGQSASVAMKVKLPSGVKSGTYQLMVRASGGGVSATAPVAMEIVGEPRLELTTRDGRLSGDAEAGAATPIALLLKNTGSAPARNISLSGTTPGKWKVEFSPAEIDELPAGAERPVQVLLTPGDKAVAGDYMATFRANAEGASASAEYRVTVTTSTLWGVVGIAIIAVALLAVLGVVARFGRR
jgi:uncharacterized membrane protein